MRFTDALHICLERPFSFQGRARRSEFWWIFLILYLAMIALVFVTVLFFGIVGSLGYLLFIPGGFALMAAQLAVSARRLHDKGITGWANLLVLVPFGSLALLILWLLPGDLQANDYGPPPGDAPGPLADKAVYTRSNIPKVTQDD